MNPGLVKTQQVALEAEGPATVSRLCVWCYLLGVRLPGWTPNTLGSYAVGSDGGGVADVKAHLLRLTFISGSHLSENSPSA